MEFVDAKEAVTRLSKKPDNQTMLRLYALYKQGSEGDIGGERPGGFDFVGQAKFDAWAGLAGKSQDDAQREYVALVQELQAKDGQ